MKSTSYELYIDTGGTFTDCLARDWRQNWYRRKVLSNSTLRGSIETWCDAQALKISHSWEITKDILVGYRFQLLQKVHSELYVKSFDPENDTLVLSNKLPEEFVGDKLSFEILSPEEVPIFAARLITQTPINQTLPPLYIKLGSTKGTNALLEGKGAEIAFFVTKGFQDILRIGYQQRPDIFALNVVKPDLLYQ
ncbi:MAG: 5-oxoprolinase, partial [Planctomycetes bacterium]|nr:5-oxoprolinase [Planctomycetota bacterium]